MFICMISVEGVLIADENPQQFSTPGYPNRRYPNDIHCEWNIQTKMQDQKILLQFLDSDLEIRFDVIRIIEVKHKKQI